MAKVDRAALGAWWAEAWESGLWAASWKESVQGLTGAQASWAPAEGRHSIWQIVNHLMFWREDCLLRAENKPRVPEPEAQRRNFEAPAEPTDAAWHDTVARFAESHRKIGEAIANPDLDASRIEYLIPHDNYHIGQIMYLRAMQGLRPIE